LEKAAETGSREVSSRAIEILKKHYERGDFETKEAATAALSRLAKSGNPSVAQRAEAVLHPPAETAQPQPIFGGGFAVPVRGANIQIQVQAGNAAGGVVNRRMHVRETN